MASRAGNNAVSEQHYLKNSAILVFVELSTKFLGLFLFIEIARTLGSWETGVYYFGIMFSSFFAIASKFGFQRRVLKEIGRDPSLLYSHYQEINLLKLVFTTGALFLYWVTLVLMDEANITSLMLIGCFVMIDSFILFVNSLFRGIGKPHLELLVRTIFSVLNLGLGLTVLHLGWGLEGVITTQLIAAATALFTGFVIVHRVAEKVHFSFSLANMNRHIIKSAPFAVNMLVIFLSDQANVILLSELTEKNIVGYFGAAGRIFETFTLVPAAIMGAFLPMISRLYTTSIGRFVRSINFTMKYLYVIAVPIVVGTWIVHVPLIKLLYSDQFEPSGVTLAFLNTSLIFSFWNWALSSVLIAVNRERDLPKVFVYVALVHITGNLLLIPYFDQAGAGMAVVITQAFLFFMQMFYVRRYVRGRTLARLIWRPTLAALAMGLASYLALQIHLFLAIATGVAVYVIMLFVTRAVRGSDMKNLKAMVTSKTA